MPARRLRRPKMETGGREEQSSSQPATGGEVSENGGANMPRTTRSADLFCHRIRVSGDHELHQGRDLDGSRVDARIV